MRVRLGVGFTLPIKRIRGGKNPAGGADFFPGDLLKLARQKMAEDGRNLEKTSVA
jgi:hypothetical protein